MADSLLINSGNPFIFQIRGMTCSSCVHTIESNISKRNGLISASVALATSKGRFKFNPELTGPRDIMNAIQVVFTSFNCLLLRHVSLFVLT